MAKRKKSKAAAVGMGTVLSAALGELLADGLEKYASRAKDAFLNKKGEHTGAGGGGGGGGRRHADRNDAAAGIVRVLTDRGGAVPLDELLERTGLPLITLLRALTYLRKFRLVRQDDDDSVALTDTGQRVATAAGKAKIRADAERELDA